MIGMRCFWWKQKRETLHGENTNKGLIVFNLVTWKCDLLTLDFWHCYHSVSFVSRPPKAWQGPGNDVRGCVRWSRRHRGSTRRVNENLWRTTWPEEGYEGDFIAQAKQWAIKGQSSLSFWAQKWLRCECCRPAAVSNQHWMQPIIRKSIYKFLFC